MYDTTTDVTNAWTQLRLQMESGYDALDERANALLEGYRQVQEMRDQARDYMERAEAALAELNARQASTLA